MYVFSTFQQTIYVELVLSELEENEIPKENILAVPLDRRAEARKLFDTINRSDGVSLIDLGSVLATAFAVIGASVGFRLEWGPIIWGLIGTSVGFIIGFLIDLMMNQKKQKRETQAKGETAELILIIYCPNCCQDDQVHMVEEILWKNLALGVARMELCK